MPLPAPSVRRGVAGNRAVLHGADMPLEIQPAALDPGEIAAHRAAIGKEGCGLKRVYPPTRRAGLVVAKGAVDEHKLAAVIGEDAGPKTQGDAGSRHSCPNRWWAHCCR